MLKANRQRNQQRNENKPMYIYDGNHNYILKLCGLNHGNTKQELEYMISHFGIANTNIQQNPIQCDGIKILHFIYTPFDNKMPANECVIYMRFHKILNLIYKNISFHTGQGQGYNNNNCFKNKEFIINQKEYNMIVKYIE